MQKNSKVAGVFSGLVIVLALVAGQLIYWFLLRSPGNFVDNNADNDPVNILGTMAKGGPAIVPILIGFLLIVITVSIERFLTIGKARGAGDISGFVKKIQYNLANNDVDAAIAECDKQKGSVANVVRSGLETYSKMRGEVNMARDQKVMAIQKEVEESTSLELPMLEKNLSVIATLAPLGTLTGLIGTVIGMIRAFQAMGHAGAPDAAGLAVGISEALVNTALGILTSILAIILYNYFTQQIDGLTYGIDEAGYSIAQNFAEHNK